MQVEELANNMMVWFAMGKKSADDSSFLHFIQPFINKLVCPSYIHKPLQSQKSTPFASYSAG